MRWRTSRRDDLEVNLTPLIDVVFLLLIFFMVSTSFNRESEIQINLPEASAKPQEAKEQPIEISIDASGRFFVNRELLVNTQVATLRLALQKVAAGRNNVPLVISADATTPHQAVVTAMDAARQAGLTSLSIATANAQ